MERLKLEELARLVDERPNEKERAALESDPGQRRELEALRSQKRALGNLPAILPPAGGWRHLEEELVGNGLIQGPLSPFGVWRKWMQAAAMIVLFIGGTAFGWTVRSPAAPSNSAPDPDMESEFLPVASGTSATGATDLRPATLEEARLAVVEAEEEWLRAYRVHQELFHALNGRSPTNDPVARLAGIEAMVAASEAAVQESPADEFFNSFLMQTLWERQNTLRQISLESWH